MIQTTYKTTFPIWTEKNLQVMRGVEVASDIPLLVYRFTHNQSQKQQIENDILQFERSENPYLPIQTEYVQRDPFTYDLIIVGSNGQRLFQSPIKNQVVQLYQIFLAYDQLYKIYSMGSIGMRDITIYNIILDQQMNIKVVDFGLVFQQFREFQGTIIPISQAANAGRGILFQNYSIYWPPEVLFGYARQSWEYSLGMIYFILLTSIERENQIKEIIRIQLRSKNPSSHQIRQSIYGFIVENGRKIITQYQTMMILGLMGFQKPVLWNNIPNQPMFSQNLECIKFRKQNEQVPPPIIKSMSVSQLPVLQIQSPKPNKNESNRQNPRSNGLATSSKSEFTTSRRNLSQYERQQSQIRSPSSQGTFYLHRTQAERTVSQHELPSDQGPRLTLSQLFSQRAKPTPSLETKKIEKPLAQTYQRPSTVLKQKSAQSIIRPQSLKSTFATATDTEANSEAQPIRQVRRKKFSTMKIRENSLDNIFQQKESSESQDDTPKMTIQDYTHQKCITPESVQKRIAQQQNYTNGREIIIEQIKDADDQSLQQTLQMLQRLQLTTQQDRIIIRRLEDMSPMSSTTSLIRKSPGPEDRLFSRQLSQASPLLSPIPQAEDSREEITMKTIPHEQLQVITKGKEYVYTQSSLTQTQSSMQNSSKPNVVPEIMIHKASEQSEQEQRKRPLFDVRPVPIQTNSKIQHIYQHQQSEQSQRDKGPNSRDEEQSSLPLKSILKNTAPNVKQDDYTMILKDYQNQLSQYKLIGQCVVYAIDYLKTSKSMWIFPLFLVFKRMFQMRKEIEQQMQIPTDFLQYENFQAFSQSKEYKVLLKQIKDENHLIEDDFKKLLRAAQIKSKDFDPKKLEKIKWFLNEDITQKLQDQCFIYLYSQILPHVRQQLKLSLNTVKPDITPLEWNRLILQMLATLIITENPVMSVPLDQFDYEIFSQDYMNYTRSDQIDIIISNMESTINTLKQRLVQKGFKI